MKMQLVECQLPEIRNSNSDIYGLLEEFRESGRECVKIVGFSHKNAQTCANSIRSAIKRYRMSSMVRCMTRGEEVYLTKKKI